MTLGMCKIQRALQKWVTPWILNQYRRKQRTENIPKQRALFEKRLIKLLAVDKLVCHHNFSNVICVLTLINRTLYILCETLMFILHWMYQPWFWMKFYLHVVSFYDFKGKSHQGRQKAKISKSVFVLRVTLNT